MIKQPEMYRDFPLRVVLYRAPLLLVTLSLGGVVAYGLGWIALTGYVVYALIAILWTMRNACRHCGYHGKRCDLGVSLVASLLHPVRGNAKQFKPGVKVALWLLGGLLAIPLLLGIAELVLIGVGVFCRNVDGAVICPAALWFMLYVTAVVATIWTTVLSCPHCQMRSVCPLSFYRPKQLPV